MGEGVDEVVMTSHLRCSLATDPCERMDTVHKRLALGARHEAQKLVSGSKKCSPGWLFSQQTASRASSSEGSGGGDKRY